MNGNKVVIQEKLDKNKGNIITIVSMLSVFIPFITININALMNSFNIINLLIINGILLLIVSLVFWCIDKLISKKADNNFGYKIWVFVALGSALILLGVGLLVAISLCPTLKELLESMSLIKTKSGV